MRADATRLALHVLCLTHIALPDCTEGRRIGLRWLGIELGLRRKLGRAWLPRAQVLDDVAVEPDRLLAGLANKGTVLSSTLRTHLADQGDAKRSQLAPGISGGK